MNDAAIRVTGGEKNPKFRSLSSSLVSQLPTIVIAWQTNIREHQPNVRPRMEGAKRVPPVARLHDAIVEPLKHVDGQ